MLKLRTTTSLSLLALVIGVAGTAWLSGLTDDWQGPPPAAGAAHVGKLRSLLRRHVAAPRVAHPMAQAPIVARPERSIAAKAAELPSLTPIDMPSLRASLFSRTVLASGDVLLHLSVDGAGHVEQASVAQTSGHADLDERAVRMVLGWRFAVPSDHPDGLQGQLIMHFQGTADAP